MAPRHVTGEQHRAVGVADFHGVDDRQQHVRQHLIAEFSERLGQPHGAFGVSGVPGTSQLVDDLPQRVVFARRPAESSSEVAFLVVPGPLRKVLERATQLRNQRRNLAGRQIAVRQRLADVGELHRDIERDAVLFVAHALQATQLGGAEVEAIGFAFPDHLPVRRLARRGSGDGAQHLQFQ